MFKTYFDVRNWLENFIPQVYGKNELGLTRIENLLLKLGNPEKKFKSIHVGGTSGKGTTCFLISEFLQKKSYKVGLHVSPHLIYIGERMQINGKNIPSKRLIGLANKIKPVVDAIIANQPEKTPSYFEILVAMSFLYFAQEKVDWAVVEVGLGGRLDATNVLAPEVSVIANIGLDHTEILGDTLEKIAGEKSGIIKNNVPIVTGATGKGLKVIEKTAKIKKSLLINLYTQKGKLNPKTESILTKELPFDIFGYNLYSARRECIYLAILTVLTLGIVVSKKTINEILASKFPGRFEEIDDNVIIDGAHNIDKIRALLDFVFKSKIKNQKLKVILVIAFKKGKNWQEMIDLLLKNLPIKKIITTEYQAIADTGKGSSVKAQEIADYLTNIKRLKTKAIKNSQGAVFEAISNKKPDETVLVSGSLYLVGEARAMWQLPEF